MTARIILLFIILSSLISEPLRAQENTEQSGTELLETYFNDVLGGDERLVNGPYYYAVPEGNIDGHPFYFNREWKNGIVWTKEAVFANINIRYDITINRLILSYLSSENSVNRCG